uniref:MLO-like protein n=1 Tax=Kalanchoe fedtschenkoi TaxID=63787 RepID=A0A7N0RFZ4_KALFE
MDEVVVEGRSLAETPTWSVATVITVMVFVCFIVERSIHRFGKWLEKTKRKALAASLEKVKEELMLLGLISLLLGHWARSISQICVSSSLFTSRFFICSEADFGTSEHVLLRESMSSNDTVIPPRGINYVPNHQCGQGREPFVSHEGLEQLHRFLFVLGITHVLYSCLAVALAMGKIYSWQKWEDQACLQAKINKVMKRQTTFVFHHTSHPWTKNQALHWMLCFVRQFRRSIHRSDYLALRLGFITNHRLPLSYNFHKYMVRSMEDELQGILGISWPLWAYAIICIFVNIHGLNIYFWLSFIPAVLVILVGTKLEHVVSSLALEVAEQTSSAHKAQVKPRDDLFWFGKPHILIRLIQFIIFQNAFEMATFLWSLWGLKQRSCFMKNHAMIIIRLVSGVLVQFWCSYSTVPVNVIVTQMGSKFRKALMPESVRDSLHNWCKRVKERSKRGSTHSVATRSVCSVESPMGDLDDTITVGSVGTLSRTSSAASLNYTTVTDEVPSQTPGQQQSDEHSFEISEEFSSPENGGGSGGDGRAATLLELFQRS